MPRGNTVMMIIIKIKIIILNRITLSCIFTASRSREPLKKITSPLRVNGFIPRVVVVQVVILYSMGGDQLRIKNIIKLSEGERAYMPADRRGLEKYWIINS